MQTITINHLELVATGERGAIVCQVLIGCYVNGYISIEVRGEVDAAGLALGLTLGPHDALDDGVLRGDRREVVEAREVHEVVLAGDDVGNHAVTTCHDNLKRGYKSVIIATVIIKVRNFEY